MTPEQLVRDAAAQLGVAEDDGNTGTGAGDLVDVAAETWSPPSSPPTPAYRPKPGPLDPDALYGVAGQIVAMVDPHTEADPVAVLAQTLVWFGNMAGRYAHFMADSARHAMNLNAVLIGRTSKGRKGTSANCVRRVFEMVDEEWVKNNIKHGLSSGEGLIWNVRDPIYKRAPIRNNGRTTDYEDVMEDAGITDKRMLVSEGEWASPLKMMKREGNVLSTVIRLAWDDGNLRVMTKNNPAVSTDAHVSIVGHVTDDELRREMNENESSNGFGNRILWLHVERSKALPDGGCLDTVDFSAVVEHLRAAKEFSATVGRLDRDDAARDLWHTLYADLSEGRPGIVGALTGRAEAQVMRLALVYAVLDLSDKIRTEHLLAALALWRYSEQSVEFTFGSGAQDRGAKEIDRLVKFIREQGGEISPSDLQPHRHWGQGSESVWLNKLTESGRALWVEPQKTGKPGRPAKPFVRLI